MSTDSVGTAMVHQVEVPQPKQHGKPGGLIRHLNFFTGLACGVVLALVFGYLMSLQFPAGALTANFANAAAGPVFWAMMVGWVIGFMGGMGAFIGPFRAVIASQAAQISAQSKHNLTHSLRPTSSRQAATHDRQADRQSPHSPQHVSATLLPSALAIPATPATPAKALETRVAMTFFCIVSFLIRSSKKSARYPWLTGRENSAFDSPEIPTQTCPHLTRFFCRS